MFDYGSQRARERAASCQPVFVLQTQTVFDGSLSGCPFYIYTDHTVLANRRYPGEPENVVKSDGWLARERLAYRFADHIFTSSDFARMSLIEDYDCLPEDVTTVGGGVNIEVPPSYPLRKRPVRTILFLGLDWKRKGGPDLVRAFRRLRTSVPDLRLIIAGAAPRLDEPGISVRGVVKPSEVPGLFAEADIFCMPSHVEPSAGVYLEAAAYGLPVVATHVGGTPERVVDGVTGYLCEPGDDVALESLLIELVQSPILASDMGRAGYEMAQTSGTWSIVASRIAAIIRSRI
jgi:glycosyltransferase involved in cell wall biosynthesis